MFPSDFQPLVLQRSAYPVYIVRTVLSMPFPCYATGVLRADNTGTISARSGDTNDQGASMSGFSSPSRDESPAQTVRTIGRLAQILIELRDEYAERPRDDTMSQIEQRLDELVLLRDELKSKLEHARDEA